MSQFGTKDELVAMLQEQAKHKGNPYLRMRWLIKTIRGVAEIQLGVEAFDQFRESLKEQTGISTRFDGKIILDDVPVSANDTVNEDSVVITTVTPFME